LSFRNQDLCQRAWQLSVTPPATGAYSLSAFLFTASHLPEPYFSSVSTPCHSLELSLYSIPLSGTFRHLLVVMWLPLLELVTPKSVFFMLPAHHFTHVKEHNLAIQDHSGELFIGPNIYNTRWWYTREKPPGLTY
jgi:hypothetical protein